MSAVGRLVIIVLCVAASSCSLAPGTYLGVTAKVNETGDNYDYGLYDAKDIGERADIFAITPDSLAVNRREDAQEKAALPQSSLPVPRSNYQYRIGSQDVLHITVWNHPEINNPQGSSNATLAGRTVNQDGTFFFPYAGLIKAAGRTVQDIRDELAKKLSKVLVDPQVDVSILHYRSKRAFVLGQVEKPGVVPITDVPLSVTDLVSQGGGMRPDANLRAAALIRGDKHVPVDLYALYYEGDIAQNIPIENGDVLTIPENRFNKIFVLGEVGKPQSIVMPRGKISLAEALSDAGGFNPLSANAGQLYVIRSGANNKPQIWHLNAASPDALVLADQFALHARDIVYVDPANVARFSRVINNIIPSASFIRSSVQN